MRGGASVGGSPGSSSSGGAFGWKLFIEARAFKMALISVPSTGKCASDRSGLTSGCARIAAITLRDISVVSSRSRFLVNAVGLRPGASPVRCSNQPAGLMSGRTSPRTGSSTPRPTNQLNSRL